MVGRWVVFACFQFQFSHFHILQQKISQITAIHLSEFTVHLIFECCIFSWGGFKLLYEEPLSCALYIYVHRMIFQGHQITPVKLRSLRVFRVHLVHTILALVLQVCTTEYTHIQSCCNCFLFFLTLKLFLNQGSSSVTDIFFR